MDHLAGSGLRTGLAGRFLRSRTGSGSRSFTGHPYLRLGFTTPLPMAAELNTELETSTAAALVGEAGKLLMSEAPRRGAAAHAPHMPASAAYARGSLNPPRRR